MKKLIVCCDGTWNTADQESDGVPTPTNVRKLYNALAATDGDGNLQERYYHSGVGTQGNVVSRVLGGAYGKGISSNVKSAYEWLARRYEPGDQIYFFGFSRGAFTVRSAAGVIGLCSLLDLREVGTSQGWDFVEEVYEKGYRKRRAFVPEGARFHDFGAQPDTYEARDAGEARELDRRAPIKLVGAWDTVGALGVPNDLEVLNLFDDPRKWAFHDVSLGKRVQHARHALALDEQRSSFTPTRWDEDARAQQVWFPGVHSDVGGGYVETGLSDGALVWMIEEASATGLRFNDWMVDAIEPNPQDVLHDSFTGLFKALRSRPRATPPVSPEAGKSVHSSALERQARPPITQAPYRNTRLLGPGQEAEVDVFARDRWNDTGVYLAAGRYRFSASGEWLDASIRCGPGGTRDGNFQARELVHLASSAWGRVERLWNRVRGDEEAWDFLLTRRIEDLDWFSLVGVVANGQGEGNPDGDGSPAPHEIFGIGEGREYEIAIPGYLYAFANDVWGKYDNNRGKVSLRVERVS